MTAAGKSKKTFSLHLLPIIDDEGNNVYDDVVAYDDHGKDTILVPLDYKLYKTVINTVIV